MPHYNKPPHKPAALFDPLPQPLPPRAPAPASVFTDPGRLLELAMLRAVGLLFALPLMANGVLTLVQLQRWRHATAQHAALGGPASLHLLGQGMLAITLGLLMLAPFATSRRRAAGWALAQAALGTLAFLLATR